MKTNYANAGMLDMIFEHRNKAYGAYVLRRDYNQSLKKALAIALSSVFLLLFGNFLREKMHQHAATLGEKSTVVTPQEIAQITKPVEAPKPPEPKQQAAPIAKAAAENPEKKVVAENQPHKDSIATVDDLAKFESGLHSKPEGATDGSGVTDGTGKEHTIGPATQEFVVAKNTVYDFTDEMPIYPGGENALFKFLRDHTDYPYYEKDLGISGKVISQFTVNEDGSVSDIKILRSPSSGFDKEVARVVKMLSAFKPGKQAGRAVKVRYVLPFTFSLRD